MLGGYLAACQLDAVQQLYHLADMGWLPNKCSFLSLSSDAVNVCDHTQSLKMNVTVCFGRGAGEAGCSGGRLCCWVAASLGGCGGRTRARTSSLGPCICGWCCWCAGLGCHCSGPVLRARSPLAAACSGRESRHAHKCLFAILVSKAALPSRSFFWPGEEQSLF